MAYSKLKSAVENSHEMLFQKPYNWIITISITSLNFLITYDLRDIGKLYLFYFLVDLLTTYLILEFYAYGIRFLNKKLPIDKDFVKRFTYQLSLHTLSVIIFTIALNELFDLLLFDGNRLSLSFQFYTKDTALALVFILFLHALYFGLFFMLNIENLESLKITPKAKVKVASAEGFKFLSIPEIALVYSSSGVTKVFNNDFNRFTSNLTLKEFEEILDDNFFRANRKSIISKEMVDSYKSVSNGKISVSLKLKEIEGLSNEITISRDKAASFRSWLK